MGPKLKTDDPTDAKRKVRTLADLAKIAGVSTGTVSRALAGKELVNQKTRDHIQALAREYGFRPNQMASNLRTQRTGVIRVAIPLGHDRRQHISDPFFMTLLGYLADELTEGGYDLMLSRVIPDQDPDWLDRMTNSGMSDGTIVIGQSDQFELIEHVAQEYVPLVTWGNYRKGQVHCVVGSDNRLGGRLAAEKLVASGAKKIAFFGDTMGIEIASRLEGARNIAEVVHFPTHLAIDEMDTDIAKNLALMDPAIDAIIAASDLIAMACIRQLRERGVDVPGAVQIIGFDDLPSASQMSPPLTTIKQDFAVGAAAMVDILKRRLAGEKTGSVVMPPRLVERGTTRPG